MKSNNCFFAEIIKSSLDDFVAQTWQWDNFPQFGSVVVTENEKRQTFAIVYDIQTGSLDPIHTPMAYQKTENELKTELPHIFEFLKTTFSCLTIGYEENEKYFYQLSPEPPKIHTFVSHPKTEQLQKIFQNPLYLHVLFGYSNKIGNIDELLLALLKFQSNTIKLTQDKIHDFINSFSILSGNDYRRLKLFLQRAQNIIK